MKLTAGLKRREAWCRRSAARFGRRVGAELGEESVAGGALASGRYGSTPGESAKPAEGLSGPEWHRRRVIAASSKLTCAALLAEFDGAGAALVVRAVAAA